MANGMAWMSQGQPLWGPPTSRIQSFAWGTSPSAGALRAALQRLEEFNEGYAPEDRAEWRLQPSLLEGLQYRLAHYALEGCPDTGMSADEAARLRARAEGKATRAPMVQADMDCELRLRLELLRRSL